MKITGTSSYVKIKYNGKMVKVLGEMVIGGFVAFKNSMKAWEEPHQLEEFNDEIRNLIIDEVKEYCKDKEFKVEFE
ncbi:Imm74 family immunity protein [Vallitalea guaymasensis]|uniref:Imm74 family immunity protein n=1 Tax=Vallitalea guaymasensis TaxID=1185412 RepID=UPI000DE292E2|nr:Imm74 family immunity protein [Vallitalea guaymasensis]